MTMGIPPWIAKGWSDLHVQSYVQAHTIFLLGESTGDHQDGMVHGEVLISASVQFALSDWSPHVQMTPWLLGGC